MPRSLYICYFGVREPLVQTQVIPYLGEIMKDGVNVSLLTFEPDLTKNWTREQIEAEKSKLAVQGITWHCLAYHKSPSALATAYDIFRGSLFVRRLIANEQIDILHGRVHIPTLMGAIGRKFSRRKPKLLFDIRGFFPEEYTDAGIWPENGWLYRSAKRVENWLMKESDGFVVLTEKAREILFPESIESDTDKLGRPVEVIPCCVDIEGRFPVDNETSRDEVRAKLGVEDRYVITHVGALGGLYLTKEIVDFLDAALSVERNTFALFLTQTDPAQVISLMQKKGFTEHDYLVRKVGPAEIPGYLSASDVGISFVKSTYATQSRSPTKIPEYLAAGLPIISNRGVGDVDKLIETGGVGVLIDDFSRESYVKALAGVSALGVVGEKCRKAAWTKFDLGSVGGERYRRLYKRLG